MTKTAQSYRRVLPGIIPALCNEVAKGHHGKTQHEPRHNTGREKAADGKPGGHAHYHHKNRGRDDGAHGGGGRGHGGGKAGSIALAHHARHQDGAHGRGVGHGRTRDAAKEHGSHYVGVGQSAGDAPHQHIGEIDQPPGSAAPVHEFACQHEKRHRHE